MSSEKEKAVVAHGSDVVAGKKVVVRTTPYPDAVTAARDSDIVIGESVVVYLTVIIP